VQLQNYVNITAYDQQALKFAIAHMGPVSVAIDASHKSLSFYANGVYYDPACGKLNSIIHFTAGTIFCFSHLTDFSYFSLKKKKAENCRTQSEQVKNGFRYFLTRIIPFTVGLYA
jgi:hypothetical protein